MIIIKEVNIDGKCCPVMISDEREALQAAHAAGRAIIGIWDTASEECGMDSSAKAEAPDFPGCLYVITDPDDVSQQLLERAARRHLDLPWILGETGRLLIREFSSDDPLEPASGEDGCGTFSDWSRREAYRKNQYVFSECGLWALVEKESGQIIGKAGITGEELGYHIYPAFRRRGYGREACEKIIKLAKEELELSRLFLHIREENTVSLHLAECLGFHIHPNENEKEAHVYEMVLYFT